MATDLSWVTDDNELEAIAKGDMSKVSDATLERLSAGDQPAPVAPMPIDDSAMRAHFQNNITNHTAHQ